ncbi:type II toxin-antitoxin system RelE/ParE family toxin [Deltaproteobacteria bacterium PRO3]|nr:type II toxin-antitoxin system RelE/ParE family toxin [Deltaproteobacteria bacterium PRO3]
MKKYTVRLAPHLRGFLRKLHPGIKSKIRKALEELERDPGLGKPLKEQLEGLHSYRVSGYRIVYRINRREIWVEVIEIAERKIVYENVMTLVAALKSKNG